VRKQQEIKEIDEVKEIKELKEPENSTQRRPDRVGQPLWAERKVSGWNGGIVVDQSRLMLARIRYIVKCYYSLIRGKLQNLFERFCKEKKTKG
jgi:hypothetical protein